MKILKPNPSEYLGFNASYIALCPNDGQLLKHLKSSLAEITHFAASLTEQQLNHRYAPDKWTMKEILVHLLDAERIFCYRALRFARLDSTPLSGFDENIYTPASRANQRSIKDILAEFKAVRKATLALFKTFRPDSWLANGMSNKNMVSVRALAYLVLGHQLHHVKVYKERYLL